MVLGWWEHSRGVAHLTATREFAHASVWIDLSAKQARIDWH